jgi:hypothetical protein
VLRRDQASWPMMGRLTDWIDRRPWVLVAAWFAVLTAAAAIRLVAGGW